MKYSDLKVERAIIGTEGYKLGKQKDRNPCIYFKVCKIDKFKNDRYFGVKK